MVELSACVGHTVFTRPHSYISMLNDWSSKPYQVNGGMMFLDSRRRGNEVLRLSNLLLLAFGAVRRCCLP